MRKTNNTRMLVLSLVAGLVTLAHFHVIEHGGPQLTAQLTAQVVVGPCGDGILNVDESCDDGDTTSGDGCSALCLAEIGWSCTGTPSVCVTTCGDNIQAGSEACDTGGISATCDGDCTVPSCGDQFLNTLAAEACDSGENNGVEGHCNTSCTGLVDIICGSGLVGGAEECDDGDTQSGDGCSAACAMEDGWYCFLQELPEGGYCRTHCGDGMVAGTEQCDDGNTTGGDGCNGVCEAENGYVCSATPVTPACSDGINNDGDNLTDEADVGCAGPNDLVEKETALYVSVDDGDDANPGTIDGPFETLAKARETVRGLIAAGLTSDVVVALREGTYYLDETFTLGAEDSGTDEFKIVWRSYPGEEAKLSTTERMDGSDWEPLQEGDILRRPIPEGRDFYTLLEETSNGQIARAYIAQEPDWEPPIAPTESTYFLTDGARMAAEDGCLTNQFRFRAADAVPGKLDPSFDYSNAKVYLQHADYFFNLIKIVDVNFGTQLVSLAENAGYPMPWGGTYTPDTTPPCQKAVDDFRLNNRFRILNVRDFLDQPGEFYVDTDENYLYYWPRESDVQNRAVYAPKTRRIVSLEGSEADPVHDIEIYGLTLFASDFVDTFAGSLGHYAADDAALLWGDYVRDVTIDQNQLVHGGLHGVYIRNGTQILIRGNTVEDAGGTGIIAIGDRNAVTHNELRQIGVIQQSGRGVRTVGNDVVIRSNTLDDIGYGGITPQGARLLIADNEISNFVARASDAGGVYMWANEALRQSQKVIVIDHNYIHDYGTILSTHTRAIYEDAYGIELALIRNNLLYVSSNFSAVAILLTGNWQLLLNNIFVMHTNNTNNKAFSTLTNWGETKGNLFLRNIILRLANFPLRAFDFDLSPTESILNQTHVRSAYNLLWQPTNYQNRGYYVGPDNGVPWSTWTAAGHDQGSLTADPKFNDPVNRNFTMATDSPAITQLGFKPIVQDFGVTLPADRPEEMRCSIDCGDGLLLGDESCDDGDTTSGDGCSALCLTEIGWACSGEPSICITTCGDNIQAGSEACDTGGISATCDGDCTAPSCGDQFLNTIVGEACDSGANNGVEGACNASCTGNVAIVCGNGLVGGGEECDDGDTQSGDGCSSSCEMEAGWYCFLQPMPNGEHCRTHCGDGQVVVGTETCDDGNATSGDGCDRTCHLEVGFSWSVEPVTPACNDGMDNDGDGLSDLNDPGCTNENDTVEKESSLFVSLTGDDQNPGTAAEPFQTLERAREVARGILAGGLTSDLVINIRSGTHFLTDRFLLEPQDSGNNGFRVIWRSHPNEQATLTTAERLDPDDWEPYQNGILRMPLPEGREFFTLLQEQANGDFARGHMAQEPDWDATKWDPITVPGSGSYFHTDGARMYTLDGCRSKNRFRFPDWEVSADSPDLIDPNADYRFAKVYLGHADYFFELHNIQSINFETRQIILTGSGNYYMPWDDYGGPDTNRPCQKSLDNMGFHLTNRFRLLNTLAFLDQPGEFFINPDENYLYYMPREDDDAPVIYAPRTHGLLKLEGTPSNLVRNIEIHGLKLFGTDYVGQFFGIIAANSLTQDGALIRFNNVNDSAITENTLIHSGTRGVVVTGSGNLVKGNTIHNMGASGMGVGGNFNVISHNDLAHIGELQFSARGIEHYGYDGATRSNRLEYTGYLGIAMGRRQFVSDNDVSHPLSRSTDAGGLYGYMNKDSVLLQGNTVLEHNYVHDYRQLPGFPTRALGIYLDGWGRDDLLVRNNLLMSGYWGDGNNMRVKGKSNFYLNNIFAMDQRMGASNMFASFTDEPQHISWGNMLVRNILVRLVGSSADGTRHRVYSVPGSTQDAVLKTTKFITRLNVTHSPPTKIAGPRINGSNTTSQVTWDQWQSAGHDAGSLIGDPLLVDPLNGDFRLQMDNDGLPLSPELKQIGFKPFTTVFGPKAASERFEEMHVSVVCGDNLIKGDETCDDGNTIDGDGCSSFCQVEHPAAPICGDGNVAAPEGCDDGDIFNGNGCSDTCQVETGWECTLGVEDTCIVDPISGSVTCWDPDRSFCSPICGDGLKHGVEVCDDGDTVAGDGCNDACTIELGYACIGEPSICSVACGDGIRMGTETCDDGNATPNDGCTVCSLDLGYECTTETPNTCTTVCGDGLIRGHEACDDSDEVDGDGCNSLCLAEPGYTCLAEPSACTTVCGDGLIRGVEECDDSGIIASDGCSSLCVLESGFSCTDQPSTCVTVCGDGIIAGNEQCDDSNTGDHDGCSAICATEAGFTCTAQPSDCHSICGDGLIRNGETCDDLNQTNSDGCNSLCNVEAGYSCQSEPSVCTQTIVIDCGNGMLESIETCDDGNETAGDGCSGLCQLESGWQCQVTPSQCMTVCGDNIVAGSEVCDDGTDNGTEGFCSADCTVQLPDCGNGIVAVLEHCDDGNEINNDGCSASCIEETGFDCDGEPSVCGNICGDTLLRGIELCDDGNLQPDDGCNAHCMLEEGYACNQTTLICATVCGDAIIAGGEECDDGGTTAGDGCSGNCRLESSSSSSSDSVDQSSSTTSEASSSISSGTGSSAGTETSSSTPMISSSSSSEQPIGNTVSSQPSSFSPTVFSAGSRSSVAIANVPIIDIEAAYRAQQEVIRQRIEAERQAALSSQAASSSATQWQTTSEGQVVIAEGELHGAAVAVSEDAVALLENRNVLRGQGDSRENLDLGSPVNRAETVTLLLRFFRLPEKTGDAPYFDVESYDWYAPAVVSATRSALVQGYDDGTFRPANNVTVAEAIKMIVVGAGWLPAGQGQPGEKWYQPYLEEATRRGLMDSLPAMWPNEPALRGWVAQMLVNTGL